MSTSLVVRTTSVIVIFPCLRRLLVKAQRTAVPWPKDDAGVSASAASFESRRKLARQRAEAKLAALNREKECHLTGQRTISCSIQLSPQPRGRDLQYGGPHAPRAPSPSPSPQPRHSCPLKGRGPLIRCTVPGSTPNRSAILRMPGFCFPWHGLCRRPGKRIALSGPAKARRCIKPPKSGRLMYAVYIAVQKAK
jgi:hypothetical protein